MSKKIRFSDHALLKIDLLSERGIAIAQEFIVQTIRFPDRREPGEGEKVIAQKQLNENLVLRVVYP
ncbi:DUF4258 domain-containing protein [Coleofasciculus sp. H7-2]|uniref:DUF4258 domain-containing protein n=1 Tax=Coleofasciculus sp. H7-2 TaxID=3351545 RepID=UPI00366FFF2B